MPEGWAACNMVIVACACHRTSRRPTKDIELSPNHLDTWDLSRVSDIVSRMLGPSCKEHFHFFARFFGEPGLFDRLSGLLLLGGLNESRVIRTRKSTRALQ
jgi:hypothetical protein